MNDLISRQAAIDAVLELIEARRRWVFDASGEIRGLDAAMCEINNLPSAEPERKTGKWVGVKEYCDHLNEKAEREGNGHRFIPSGMNICVYCNQCWESNDRRTTYCPNCGADMRGGEHATD